MIVRDDGCVRFEYDCNCKDCDMRKITRLISDNKLNARFDLYYYK